MRHPLVRWCACRPDRRAEIEHIFGAHFNSGRCRPALHHRLVAGLLELQDIVNASDDGCQHLS